MLTRRKDWRLLAFADREKKTKQKKKTKKKKQEKKTRFYFEHENAFPRLRAALQIRFPADSVNLQCRVCGRPRFGDTVVCLSDNFFLFNRGENDEIQIT